MQLPCILPCILLCILPCFLWGMLWGENKELKKSQGKNSMYYAPSLDMDLERKELKRRLSSCRGEWDIL